MEKVIDGFKKYQIHPYTRALTRQSVVWSSGQTRLIWHASKGREPKARILVMPSMINGPEILDILPDVSLVRWLAEQAEAGVEALIIEPTAPQDEISQLAESIRGKWHSSMSKRAVGAMIGKTYAGSWAAKIDQIISYLSATTTTESAQNA